MDANFTVQRIPSKETYEWILKKHYAKRIPSISYAFGLFEDNILRGICTFGMPASHQLCIGVCGIEYQDKVIELNRLCVECDEKNITSFFVSKCLSFFDDKIIVSYADTKQGHKGKIYQATNFIFTGTTKERTDIGSGENKHSRHYNKDSDYSKNRVKRSAKHRYIYFTGNKRFKRDAKRALKYPICDYPKGDTKRYDASYNPDTQMILF